MIILQWTFVFGFLVITLEADSINKQNGIQVHFTVTHSYMNIRLVCDVKYASEYSKLTTILKCPFGTQDICYLDCDKVCPDNKNCLPMISNCSKNRTVTSMKFSWNIDATKVHQKGNWFCQHGNARSNSISIDKHVVLTNNPTKIHRMITSTTKKSISNEIVSIPKIISTTSKHLPQTQSVYQENPSEFWLFITNPNVVLVLVCVFTVSLLFNIYFLIRCALLRSLIDQYVQFNKISDSCLYRCFCIRINDGLPQSNQNFINKSNPGNSFIVYHREDVYDDMSASSQADRHLINYSQYELEQDTLVARKYWTGSDGSQSILTRQPQFLYAGQPKSNYVIVSGPVCTNRGHGPFLTPSNTNFLTNSQRTCTSDETSRPSCNEYVCNESIIYSQPMKNRPKSFGQFTEGDTVKMTELCPPAPPVRTCTDPQCFRNSTPCAENMQQSLNMKNVDLIEHCSHSAVKNPIIENVS